MGLGLDRDLKLLDPERQLAGDPFEQRHLQVQARAEDPVELSEPLDDDGALLMDQHEHREQREQHDQQQNGCDHDQGDGH